MSAGTSFPFKAHSHMSICSWYCSSHSRLYLQWHLSALAVLQRVIWNPLHPSSSAFISPNSWQPMALPCPCSSVFYRLLYSWCLTVNKGLYLWVHIQVSSACFLDSIVPVRNRLVFHGLDIAQFIHSLKGILIASRLRQLGIKLL